MCKNKNIRLIDLKQRNLSQNFINHTFYFSKINFSKPY